MNIEHLIQFTDNRIKMIELSLGEAFQSGDIERHAKLTNELEECKTARKKLESIL